MTSPTLRLIPTFSYCGCTTILNEGRAARIAADVVISPIIPESAGTFFVLHSKAMHGCGALAPVRAS